MDLDSVVDELYGLDPSEFTARRDQRASEARKEGDRELATAIKALRRPSAAAFTVNLMARAEAGEIERLIDLGARLRQAQAALSGDELRALGRQRSQLVAGLAQEARNTAHRAGHPISEATGREVQATFEAALADEPAGEAVRAGRLVRSLERRGMEPVDLDGAVAGPLGAGSPPPRDTRAERDEARERAQAAEAEARRLEALRSQAQEARDRAAGVRQEAEESVQRLEDQLAAARRQLDKAVEAERAAHTALARAEADASPS